jgi:hypothetical protein
LSTVSEGNRLGVAGSGKFDQFVKQVGVAHGEEPQYFDDGSIA